MNFEARSSKHFDRVSPKGCFGQQKQDAGPFAFGTKSETLFKINKLSKNFTILPIAVVQYSDWQEDRDRTARTVWSDLEMAQTLIVRSSCAVEDSEVASHAGEFLSLLNIKSLADLDRAIDDVFMSYGKPTPGEQVLVQPMAREVVLSGVAMTADAQSGAPYTIVDYAHGADTEAVTAGTSNSGMAICVTGYESHLPPCLQPLAPALRELAEITGGKPVDIEFAITATGTVIIFQVRPIVMKSPRHKVVGFGFPYLIENVRRCYKDIVKFNARNGLANALFGVMSDWNPAELIGIKPRPLTYSLYRYLITDVAWTKGRAPLGYTDMSGDGVMRLIGGTPFINVSASLSSFVPKSVPALIRSKIVADASRALAAAPQFHDKIEFEIMPTVFTPDLTQPHWRARFTSLSDAEWAGYLEDLLKLTNGVVAEGGTYDSIMADVVRLEAMYEQKSDLKSANLMDATRLLSWVRHNAAPLFSGAARSAFIATSILRVLARTGYIHEAVIEDISRSAQAIGSELVRDFQRLERDVFMARYGHIRPGTFDITVPRYDQEPEKYFSFLDATQAQPDVRDTGSFVELSASDIARIDAHFAALGYNFNWARFRTFAASAIHAREYVKFLYTKQVSDALEIISNVGVQYGCNREEMSFLTLSDIENMLDFTSDIDRRIREISASNRVSWQQSLPVRLPDLLTSPDDIFGFEVEASAPNFVTYETVQAPVALSLDNDLRGKIVFIETADPGYDWVFTRGIAGFITRYGGENSHMAIRAREFGIPAVVGAGRHYDKWKTFSVLRCDCRARRVEPII
ncbi:MULTISPECIES: PEP-utilizing enzyme [Rhizobium/Agrobacterium group]|nr:MULTISPECIES: PEP-utilizing enzyme [Rhizobium/Agrobacterium group]MCF1484087.1 PTS sugar transporter [Allorhizobium ampelinum]NSZ45742.1 PTS sugar transporter [Agrobacterium vitis]NTA29458.1 PTS sugar transporter [Allorhizobium ampelinum]OVE88452.1 hypothetical protein B7W85_23615 [Allorhizobium ampelinum]